MARLRVGMRNPKVLARIGNLLGSFLKPDKAALQAKLPVQRIRIVHDVLRRVLERREFWFTPEISVSLNFQYEKCHGICKGCGFFSHGGGVYDKSLLGAPEVVVEPGAIVVTGSVETEV